MLFLPHFVDNFITRSRQFSLRKTRSYLMREFHVENLVVANIARKRTLWARCSRSRPSDVSASYNLN